MPKGYLIGHVTIHNLEAYRAYGAANDEIFPRFGGRFLARGGASSEVEGGLPPRHVIVEFPSYEDALACYNSPEYQENMKIRLANADGAIAVVEGVPHD
ncbi:DUF1330 domain-containing protein [Roseobacteraceae bacterium S113]